jgi:preprotein translocase subunit YajC
LLALVPLAQSGSGSSAGALGFLLPLVLMGGIFYFLLVRPQQRQRRRQSELLSGLEVGDEVQTIGGMFGTIQEIDDESVTLEVSPGVEIRFVRGAIARKLVFDDDEEDEGAEHDDERDEEEAGGRS